MTSGIDVGRQVDAVMSQTKTIKKWASVFDVLGNPIRLGILLVLFASNYLAGTHSLTFTQIKTVLGTSSDAGLSYHLAQLTKSGFVIKDPYKDEKGRVFPLYRSTEKVDRLLEDLGLAETFRDYIKSNL